MDSLLGCVSNLVQSSSRLREVQMSLFRLQVQGSVAACRLLTHMCVGEGQQNRRVKPYWDAYPASWYGEVGSAK
jgi:hypothetical protein